MIYSAHWDHFGIGPEVNGDKIYHGALDNASGIAALLEIARAYSQLKPENAPKRSILFLSVTAEEQGLLGSEYYAEHPLYPVARTAANINMDGMNVWGKTKDITEIGKGKSTLDEVVAEVARGAGPHRSGRSGAGKGLLLSLRSFQLRESGHSRVRSGCGNRFRGQAGGLGFQEARRNIRRTITTSRAT